MRNIALVVLDTLRKDHFDAHFDWVDGRRFERAYSTANWTVPSHASIFTGRYASAVGVDSRHQLLDCDRPVLAETLREHGYRTRAISANHNVSSKGNWDRGFGTFVNPSRLFAGDEDVLDWEAFLATTDATGPRLYLAAVAACFTNDCATLKSLRAGLRYHRSGLRAASGMEDYGARAVLERLREWTFGDREFLYVNLMETHTPYDPPPGYPGAGEAVNVDIAHSLGLEAPPPATERAYDGAARYLSDVTRSICAELAADFDTVVLLSDHGEMLGEEGLYNHTYGLHPAVVRVPLVVCGDGLDGRSESVASLLDVHPTVLELAGVDPPDDVDGRSLLGPRDADRYLAEYRGLLYKAVERLERGGVDRRTIEAFEAPLVAAAGDDGYVYETRDGVATAGSVEGRPADVLRRARRLLRRRSTVDGAPEAAPEIPVERLEQLGYL